MKKLLPLLALLICTPAQALELPSSVMVVEQAPPPSAACESSWYIDLGQLNFFRAFSPCEQGLAVLDAEAYLDSQGLPHTEVFDFMTRNLPDTTVLQLSWPLPIESAVIRICTGCNDAFTTPDPIDISADGVVFERLTCGQGGALRPGESGSVLFEPNQDAQHRYGLATCTWTLPTPRTEIFIKGVERENVSSGTSIASIEGQFAPVIGDPVIDQFVVAVGDIVNVAVQASGEDRVVVQLREGNQTRATTIDFSPIMIDGIPTYSASFPLSAGTYTVRARARRVDDGVMSQSPWETSTAFTIQ